MGRGGLRLPTPNRKREKVETIETTYAEQFANDFLLVAENDYDTYRSLLEQEGDSVSVISDNLRENWEQLAGQVVELVEENIRRVVLRFPVKTATIWDPNQFNFLPSLQAYYEYIHKPFSFGAIQSDSTVHVISAKELTLVSYQNQYEVYAKQIGLVKKYYKDLQISNFDTLNVSQGKELYFSLLEYGH